MQELPTPTLASHGVKAEVKASGICSSDVPRALEGRAYFYPLALGHEIAGRIVEIGEEVRGVRIGGEGAVAPLFPCRCGRGRDSSTK